jgi:HAD superfamily hydrolase (TIGR01459 family)
VLEHRDIWSTLGDYELFLFDIWGVIGEETCYPDVIRLLNEFVERGKKFYFVSNAPRLRQTVEKKLLKWSIPVVLEQVVTSGEIFRDMIRNSGKHFGISDPLLYHLGADRNNEIASDLPCRITDKLTDANLLLLSLYRDEGEDLQQFDELLNSSVRMGVKCICTNPDIVVPNEGILRYCAGFFADKIKSLGGEVVYTGKPDSKIYDYVLSMNPSIDRKKVLMIGDSFETDILGANGVGIDSALVLSGNAKRFFDASDSLDQKIEKLSRASLKFGCIPNFIVKLKPNSN